MDQQRNLKCPENKPTKEIDTFYICALIRGIKFIKKKKIAVQTTPSFTNLDHSAFCVHRSTDQLYRQPTVTSTHHGFTI
jgi:hypothetical protein